MPFSANQKVLSSQDLNSCVIVGFPPRGYPKHEREVKLALENAIKFAKYNQIWTFQVKQT